MTDEIILLMVTIGNLVLIIYFPVVLFMAGIAMATAYKEMKKLRWWEIIIYFLLQPFIVIRQWREK